MTQKEVYQSPTNTRAGIDEKKRLYFEAGAAEVWVCALDRSLRFFVSQAPEELGVSAMCPDFPKRIG